MAQAITWDVRTERGTVVVSLPRGLALDREASEAINEAFADAVERPTTDSVLTLLSIENAISRGVFDEVTKGAELTAANDIEQWAIVVEEKVKGMAFESQLDGLETAVFEDEDEAREWLAAR